VPKATGSRPPYDRHSIALIERPLVKGKAVTGFANSEEAAAGLTSVALGGKTST
jgi:hypothetical protein